MRRFWDAAYDSLQQGSLALDIGTGSGVLARLWAAHPASSLDGARFEAVDLVADPPPWFRSLPRPLARRITFRGATQAEALPLADATVDLIVSQYGLEYADEKPACHELRRVLRPGGRIALVIHHNDSAPVRFAREDVRHARWLMAEGGLVDVADALLPAMAVSATPEGRARLAEDPASLELRDKVNRLMGELAHRAAQPGGDLCHDAGIALQELLASARSQGLPAAQAALIAWRSQLTDTLLRAEELVACAKDAKSIDRLATSLGGTPGNATPLIVANTLFGWHLLIHPV